MECIIYVVAYNRPEHLRKTLESLLNSLLSRKYQTNFSILLIIDGLKSKSHSLSWKQVIKIGKDFNLSVKIREKNYGLRNNILKIFEEFHESEFDSLVLIEDDVVPTMASLSYFDIVFNKIKTDESIIQFSAFSPVNYKKESLYKFPRLSTWMWGSTKQRLPERNQFEIDWENFNLQKWLKHHRENLKYMMDVVPMMEGQKFGKINSWSLDLLIWMVENKKFTLFPSKNLVTNIGFDGTGVNCGKKNFFSLKKPIIISNSNDWNALIVNEHSRDFYIDAKRYYSKNIFIRLLKLFL